MKIVFEGIWGSPVDYLMEEVVKNQELPYDRVKVCIPPPPFNGIRGWTYALTENMRIWREHDDKPEDIIIFQHSVWSSYAFAKALVGDTQLEKDEISLFKEMTDGISEVNNLPNVVVYCHSFPTSAHNNLKERSSVCSQITEEELNKLNIVMVEWLDEMKSKGVQVIELCPPYMDNVESWYRTAIATLKESFQQLGVGQWK